MAAWMMAPLVEILATAAEAEELVLVGSVRKDENRSEPKIACTKQRLDSGETT